MRLIDADKLKEKSFITGMSNGVEIEEIAVVPVGAIDKAPTVETECYKCSQIPKGKWIEYNTVCRHYKCDQCDADYNNFMLKPNFCPNCGAKMDMEGEDK